MVIGNSPFWLRIRRYHVPNQRKTGPLQIPNKPGFLDFWDGRVRHPCEFGRKDGIPTLSRVEFSFRFRAMTAHLTPVSANTS